MKRLISIATAAAIALAIPTASQALDKAQIQRALDDAYAKYKDIKEGANADYIPALAKVNPKKLPEIYIVRGKAAKGQLMILGSQPGESNYSPLWVETFVHWVHGAKPLVIKSDTQINKLEGKGMLKERGSSIILNCPVTSVG